MNLLPGTGRQKAEAGALRSVVDDWLGRLAAAGLSASTVSCYACDFRAVEEVFSVLHARPPSANDLGGLDQETVDCIIRAWAADEVLIGTINRRFSAIRSFARHLVENGNVDCSRLFAAVLPAAPRNERAAVDEDSALSLAEFKPVEATPWIAARNQAMLLMQAGAGLTSGQIAGLDLRDVVFDGDGIVVRTKQTPRIVSASQESKAALHRYLGLTPFNGLPNSPLFVNRNGERISTRSIQISFARRRLALGLPPAMAPMSLRHRFGANLAAAGKSPAAVAEALGVSVGRAARYFALPRTRPVVPSDRKRRRPPTGRSAGRARPGRPTNYADRDARKAIAPTSRKKSGAAT